MEEEMDWQEWKSQHRRKFDFAVAVYQALVATNVGLGIAILVGGPERFPFPTYRPLLELSNGSVWPWGLSILLAAVLMCLQGFWVNMAGLGLSLLWMNMFSVMFFAAYKYETSGSTAPIPYLGLAMIIVGMMTYKVVERRIRRSSVREE